MAVLLKSGTYFALIISECKNTRGQRPVLRHEGLHPVDQPVAFAVGLKAELAQLGMAQGHGLAGFVERGLDTFAYVQLIPACSWIDDYTRFIA